MFFLQRWKASERRCAIGRSTRVNVCTDDAKSYQEPATGLRSLIFYTHMHVDKGILPLRFQLGRPGHLRYVSRSNVRYLTFCISGIITAELTKCYFDKRLQVNATGRTAVEFQSRAGRRSSSISRSALFLNFTPFNTTNFRNVICRVFTCVDKERLVGLTSKSL